MCIVTNIASLKSPILCSFILDFSHSQKADSAFLNVLFIGRMNNDISALDQGHHVFECQNCFSRAVHRQDDGSYVCSVCHAIQDIQETFDEIDNLSGQTKMAYSIKITHREDKSERERLNTVVISEGLQLILAYETVSLEKFLSLPISDSVFFYLQQFNFLIQPPITPETFPNLLLILLSGITHLGIPATHADLIRWTRDGIIPYYKPASFLPHSFLDRLSKKEISVLEPRIINLNKFVPNRDHRAKIDNLKLHPLPNAKLMIWRIAAHIGVPENSFVSFCLSLARSPPFNTVHNLQLMLTEDPNQLYSITKFSKIGVAMPIALSLFALSLIYRLDGTDWISPHFSKIDFPRFSEILKGPLTRSEVFPAFPKMDGEIPILHSDLVRLMSTSEAVTIELSTIMNDVNGGFGDEFTLITNIQSLSEANNDLRFLIAGLSRFLGVSQPLILQQFSLLISKRFGLWNQKKSMKSSQT